jgi:transcriptional regulator CtsR
MTAAMNDRCYTDLPQEYRDALRAAVLKHMLMTQG